MEGLNSYQTNYSDEELSKLPQETRDQYYEALASIPFVRNLISNKRKRAKDLQRDDKGRIIVDLSNPHILEDMDFFRPTALYYMEHGEVTSLRPNANPNSDFGKWIREERRRCWEGYVRESDGEWVTGFMYWFLNYCPMQVIKLRGDGSNRADRVTSFPECWEGMYWRFHYLEQAAAAGHHAAELASRARGKSYTLASILSHNFILGENSTACKEVTSIVVASQKEYLVKDGTLNKFLSLVDFSAEHTQYPRRRRKDSMQEMLWQMGYKDLDSGTDKGSMNQVIGIAISEDESKIRGKRAAKILVEEMGSFGKLLEMYNVLLPCVQSGDVVFGQVYLVGTAGDKDSDFAGAQELIYNPQGYGIHPLENVYDKPSQGRPWFCFFFPGYVNRAGCYNKDGVSDVTKALLEICLNRYRKKYQTSDPNTIIRAIAEEPITPSEAMLRTRYNLFPVTEINERIAQIDSNPSFFNDVYSGDLVIGKNGEIKFEPTDLLPIRDFPHKDNKIRGSIEIFQMPEKDKKDNIVYRNRYIAACDPYDDDESATMSLGSIFVMDLWTDRIVAEYTGRPQFADDFFEICRRLCLFYHAMLNYENNRKGLFAYFSQKHCLHILSDTLDYLKDKQLAKDGIGNKSKGVNATLPVNNYARERLRTWLLGTEEVIEIEDDVEVKKEIPRLYSVRNRALLKELSLWNTQGNFDRVSAMGMLMLLREDRMMLYSGDYKKGADGYTSASYAGNDDFFTLNFDKRFENKKFNDEHKSFKLAL